MSNKFGHLFGIPEIPFGSTCSGFHVNLLVLYGHMDPFSISVLRGGSLHYSLHCVSTTLLNQAPSPKSSAGAVCWLGVFSVRGSDNEQLQQHQGRIIFLLGQLGYCQYLLEICVLRDTFYPLGLAWFYTSQVCPYAFYKATVNSSGIHFWSLSPGLSPVC